MVCVVSASLEPEQSSAHDQAKLREMAAKVEAAVEAREQRLKALANRLPGGDSRNYIVVLCDFLASEYHWGLDHVADLDSSQMAAFVEQALRRKSQARLDAEPNWASTGREQPENRSGGRPAKRSGRLRKGESSKEQLVIGALANHHRYQPGGGIENYTPATTARLAALASSKHVKVSVATVSHLFKRKFPSNDRGYDGYVAACNRDARVHIGMLLALWQGDVAERLRDLLPHESGRPVDDD
jgi:hypothetical protein